MSFLDKVRTDREDLARVLKKHKGIRRTVEELYPDTAHFIYELLQNAEDTHATEAVFGLTDSALVFEHDGSPFSEQDVWAITDIGEGTKAVDEDKIGRFGVGFKAVFAYTETPRIWSPTFSFEISDFVLPTGISARSGLGKKTRFEFPFNNPKKGPRDAHAEVLAGLQELAETTLLFLSHLESIRWQAGKASGEVLRVLHSPNHVEVLKQSAGRTTSTSHFLRFYRPVQSMERQQVAVAFELAPVTNVESFDPKRPLAKQLRIVSADPGRVAVFFPAQKEASGLRFHLHAPLIPELSRASIKDTPSNTPLFRQLAELSASALRDIRALNLLNSEFLAVLPNPQDTIPHRYDPIRSAIIAEMNAKPLTPTHSKSHAPAKDLLQGKASLKDLLSAEDIEFLVPYEDEPPQWAIGAAQKNSNSDRFLAGLAIRKWDVEEFVEHLQKAAAKHSWQNPNEQLMQWLAAKSAEWCQQFYAFLYHEFSLTEDWYRLEPLSIVRRSDGTHGVAEQCYFPTDDVKHDDVLPRVDEAVYSSGKSKTQRSAARKLLEAIGVREVGEAEHIQAILDQRYTAENIAPDPKDLKRFVELVERDPGQSEVFENYYIFERVDGCWGTPSQVFLDAPFIDSNLTAYYDALGDDATRKALSVSYAEQKISIERIRKFAEAVGVASSLQIERESTSKHPNVSTLRADYYRAGVRWTDSAIDDDWMIPNLEWVLNSVDEGVSRLVWKTMCKSDRRCLTARFRPNRQYLIREQPSRLVLTLRGASWIAQRDGSFVKPCDASKDLLPVGMPFDLGDKWLTDIGFGATEQAKSETQQIRESTARALGFLNAESLARAEKFAALPQEDQERFLAEYERRVSDSFPENNPRNPERRDQHVAEQAEDAPERLVEARTRSVSIGRESVKMEAEQYLRAQYTDLDGVLFCQVCKAPMPFKLDDGRFYFEKVEFLRSLKRRYFQNYLALCPNHAAMFIEANGSENLLYAMFVDLDSTELDVVLAQEDAIIRFTRTHIADLKRVIEVDKQVSE